MIINFIKQKKNYEHVYIEIYISFPDHLYHTNVHVTNKNINFISIKINIFFFNIFVRFIFINFN